MHDVRTWIEIDKKALHHNVEQFFRLIPKTTRFMAVIKSNAYGHGLVQIAKLLSTLNPKPYTLNPRLLWFGVDSITEALRLRKEGIKNPILILGYILPSRLKEAAADNIALTVSSFDTLKAIIHLKVRPVMHIKIDTGMHRQGFLPGQIPEAIGLLKRHNLKPEGIFTHFASAKDPAYPTYTLMQSERFKKVTGEFQKAGFPSLIRHSAASGAALLFPDTHLDMVRVGMGMYGYWPSQESKIHFGKSKIPLNPPLEKGETPPFFKGRRGGIFSFGRRGVELKPVLTWKTIISEIKEIPTGSFVGYDLTERVHRKTKIAVLPIGYWHGYDRGFSSCGDVLIRGRRAKVLGRVSMDMTVVDVTDVARAKTGDEIVLIGSSGKHCIDADELATKIGTSPYEMLTRINPLIKRIIP